MKKAGTYALLNCVLIGSIGFCIYAATFQVPFVFDDLTSIVQNPVIHDLDRFLSGEGYRYSPRRFVGYLSFALNYRLGGLDVFGYHLFNLAVHLVNALLVYALARLTFRTPSFSAFAETSAAKPLDSHPSSFILHPSSFIPLFAALLFVVHPIQTQAVTYIVQRLASMATMFYLLAIVLYVWGRLKTEDGGRRTEDRRRGFLQSSVVCRLSSCNWLLFAASVLFAVLAMKTKETAFTLPFAILLYEFSFFPGGWKRKLPALALFPVMAVLVLIGMLGAGSSGQELLGGLDANTRLQTELPRLHYFFTQFRVIVTYLRLLILPINQNLDYDYPIYDTFFTPQVFLSFILLATLFALAINLCWRFRWFRPRHLAPETRLMGFGVLWFFLTLSVESSFIPIVDVIYEHRLYLPSVGAFVALAAAAVWLGRWIPERLFIGIAVTVVLALGFATWERNKVWKDEVTLWQDVVTKSPRKIRGWSNWGGALADHGRAGEAVDVLRKAVIMAPGYADAHYNLGRAFLQLDRLTEAEQALNAAIALKQDHYISYANLGAVYIKTGRYEEAIGILNKALPHLKDQAVPRFSLGVAYYFQGNLQAARMEQEMLRSLDQRRAAKLDELLRRSPFPQR